jgi:aminopeptidase-like protein
MAMNLDPSIRIKRIMSLLENMSVLPRMIVSPGLDRAFELIKREIPGVVIHEYPSGSECEDWIVPLSWRVTEGFIEDETGTVVASIDENILFVAPYSEPIDGWFTKDEIEKHSTTRPDRPDAFALEHRNAYNYQLVDWGITLPFNRWRKLPEGRYHVKIEVERKFGTMKVAEYFLQGERPETICICAHIDELCNDDLSGCVTAIELMLYIESLAKRQYSYQMLLVPEMIGCIFFVHNNTDKITKTIGMLNLETIGAGDKWHLKRAFQSNARIERILRAAMKTTGIPFNEINFFEGYGNDERVFAWPTINLPGVALQRFPFPQYHTSDDTPSIVSSENFIQALKISETFVDILERDYIPNYINKLQPWLTRRNLYFDSIRHPDDFNKFNNTVIYNINGSNSIMDLSEIAQLDFFDVYDYLNKFLEQGLIGKAGVSWTQQK